jgi:EsV-1-7 cysteine-rich motif
MPDITVLDKTKMVLCCHAGCNKHASFNTIGEKGVRYCYSHKKPGMINPYVIRCQTGCGGVARYGVLKRTHCFKHKSVNAVCLIDKCHHKGCNKHAEFGFNSSQKGQRYFCSGHKSEGFIQTVFVFKVR